MECKYNKCEQCGYKAECEIYAYCETLKKLVEKKQKATERAKIYYQQNKQKCNKRSREWIKNHPEEEAARKKIYYETHKEQYRTYYVTHREEILARAKTKYMEKKK